MLCLGTALLYYLEIMTKEQLTDLTAKYLNNTATAAERAALEEWYYSFNEEMLTVAVPACDDEALCARLKERIDSRTGGMLQRRPRSGRIALLKMAAAVLLIIATGLLAIYFGNRDVYEAGQYPRLIVLEDGSKVWLNAATRLVYTDLPFLHERGLTLSGEAYFDVATNADKPFVIRSGDMMTRVLGTAFNIKAYPDEPFYITVTDGKIRLEDRKTKTVTVLTSNKQLKYTNRQAPVLATVAAQTAYAWTSGQLEFKDASFGEIARTIYRKYHVKIVFANRALEQCMITASFEKETAASRVIALLCRINNASYTFSADSTVVTLDGKGCQ